MRARWQDPKTSKWHRGTVLRYARIWLSEPTLRVACDDGKKRWVPTRLVFRWLDKVLVWRDGLNGELHCVLPAPDPTELLETEAEILERWAMEEEAKPLDMFLEKRAERAPNVLRCDLPPKEFQASWRWFRGGVGVYMPQARDIRLAELTMEHGKLLTTQNSSSLMGLNYRPALDACRTADELVAYDPFADYKQ